MITTTPTEHFAIREFACKGISCCNHSSIVDAKLLEALEQLRAILGKPIHILSGYRCKTHNTEVGGEPNSFHMKGLAADIQVDSLSPEEILAAALKVPAFRDGGIGVYKSWLHVDVRGYKARWRR